MTFNYQVGGSLPADAPSYVERQCDRDYYDLLKERKYCYVFNCRQMGKSSLRVRVTHKLQAEGVVCATIDPQKIGVEVTCEQWYASAIRSLVGDLDLKSKFDLRSWIRERELLSPVQRFAEFIETVVLQEIDAPIVIFVEEIDRLLSLKFGMDDFFGLVRSFFEDRPTKPEYNRLTFSFLGVATPTDLIQSHNTSAFNIGYAVEMAGFTLTEALPLMQGLAGKVANPQDYLAEAVKWTGGQPFLIQRLLGIIGQELAGVATTENVAVWVENLVRERIVTNWESQDAPPHLTTIRDRVLSVEEKLRGRMLGCYQQVLADGELADDRSEERSKLRLTGLVVRRDGRLISYNPIYGAVFNNAWVEGQLADLRPEFYGSAFRAWRDADEGQNQGFLLRGQALEEAEVWARGKRLSDIDEQFLQESRELANQILRLYAQRSQANLIRLTKVGLVGTVLGLFVMAGLAFQANRQRQLAEFGEIEALISSANSSFLLNRQLESLAAIVQSAKKLKYTDEGTDKTRITQSTFENLQTIVYNIRERYRFFSKKRDAPFYAAKFSPDGNILALGSFDGSVDLYQRSGKLIAQLVGLQARDIRGLSFSPDGRKIASTGQGKSVRIWDVASGKLMSKFYAHQDDILRVSFHPDGKRLLTGSKDGTVKLWDSDRGIELLTLSPKNLGNNSPDKESGSIQDTSFSPDGNLIVTAKNTTIALWDLQGTLLANAIAHDQELFSVKFHPDGQQLLTSGRDETVKLWQIKDRNRQIQLARALKGTSTDILSLNFSADGDRIALGSQDSSIQVLNSDGTLEMKLGGHTDGIFDVNFSPDGQYLLSASKDRTVRLWDLKATLLNTLYGHTSSIWSVAFSPDGKMFASGSVDKTVRLWNADGTYRQELKGHEDTVYGVSFNNDGAKLVTASDDKTVKIWNSATGKLLHSLNIHGAKLIYATFSPDQKILATLGWDKKIKLWKWNDDDNPQLLHVLEGHTGTVWSIAFSPDSQSLASTSGDQTVKIWNVSDGQNIHTMEAHSNGGLAVAYSPDGKQIGSAGKDGKLKLWNAQTGLLEQVITVTADSWIYGVTFSPDGKAIAAANANKTIKIIDRASGKLLKTLSGHTAEAYALTYSPDSKNIVSASRDNTLKLWDAETLNFNELVQRGCNLLDNYLESTPTLPLEQKEICKK